MQNMKLDNRTLQILKNFSTINPSLLFKPGSVLSTMSPTKQILAKATVPQTFESEFAIYELSKFIGVLSLFNDPELLIEDKFMTVKSGRSKMRYSFADKSTIIIPPEKEVKLSETLVTLKITTDVLNEVMKAASLLKQPEVAFIAKDGELSLSAIDSSNKSKDPYDISLMPYDGSFTMIFKVEHMKPLPGDYEVTITKGISYWKGDGVEYYIVSEHNSKFD